MTTTGQQAERRRRDWVPMGLTLCVWLCTLPLVFLLIAPWFGIRATFIAAMALLLVMAVACQMLCSGRRIPRKASTREAKP
jgi:hypothetical protein